MLYKDANLDIEQNVFQLEITIYNIDRVKMFNCNYNFFNIKFRFLLGKHSFLTQMKV